MPRHLVVNPAPGDLASGSSSSLMLGVSLGGELEWKTPLSVGPAGVSVTRSFYTAHSSGGSALVLNTVVFSSGILTSWTRTGNGGEWWFDSSTGSAQAMLMWD